MGVTGRDTRTLAMDVTRRNFLRAGGAGLGALGLGWHELDALGRSTSRSERSVILLLLVGGPSQLETWDPKPDAPAEVRGPFGSIQTSCPGVRISEHLPRMAARFDQIAIVRSVHHDSAPIHETGFQLLQTGRSAGSASVEHPHFGSVVARLTDTESKKSAPPFFIVPGPIASTGIDVSRGQTAGLLGPAYEPRYFAGDTGPQIFDAACRKGHEIRSQYGDSTFGRSCAQALQLVEAGARVVTVNMFDSVFNQLSWDCHGAAPFSTLDDYSRSLLPMFDFAFTALIHDLEQRGRLETTLVVAAGEFGRTPRVNASGGRDHWPGVWSVVLAGGGVKGGQVVGASDANAAAPVVRPITPEDLVATIYYSLGIDATQILAGADRPSYPLLETGTAISELFV